jgi:hypothetical protein
MSHYDLYAIGNALVDSEYEVSDAQLTAMGVEKRHMTLIDAERRAVLLAGVHGQHARRTGGGSAVIPWSRWRNWVARRFTLAAWPTMSWALSTVMTFKPMVCPAI